MASSGKPTGIAIDLNQTPDRMGLITGVLFFLISIQADYVPEDPTLHAVLVKLEKESGYRFLYRDALVAGKTLGISYSDQWRNDLRDALSRWSLDARIDDERKQVIIYQAGPEPLQGNSELSGLIIDKENGEKLPFATVTLEAGEKSIRGTQSDINGHFTLPLSGCVDVCILRVSYVGFDSYSIEIDPASENHAQLALRLTPSPFEISEIIVTGTGNSESNIAIFKGMLEAGTFSPAGESNSIRMLQLLPAVNNGSSMVDGAYIRGSNSDALQVLLDGTVIYNRSHLFGLIDSFNSDIIRTGSFYYDIAPARFHAPPGGVLSLVTKSGSLHSYGGSAGISNAVIRGSAEGPLKRGKSSWLLAGRHSIIDEVNLFNVDKMISWGLDSARPSSLAENADLLTERISTPMGSSVKFYDLHGKILSENSRNGRWAISGYMGGDQTSQETERLVRTGFNSPGNRFDRQEFLTENNWGNRAFNVSYYQNSDGSSRNMHIQGGYSYYYTGFFKEDFVYQRPGLNQNEQLLYVDDFENESVLNHGYIAAELGFAGIRTGMAINLFDTAYLERSLSRSEFIQRSQPVMPEIYLDADIGSGSGYRLNGGLRMQYYSDGDYLNVSPRLKLSLFTDRRISAALGYSRNYQYLYRLSIYSLTTADIWITAVPGQAPSQSDTFTSGGYIDLWEGAKVQAEAYLKWQKKLRYHEINIQNLDVSFEDRPWFADNDGFSRGIEMMFRQILSWAEFSQSYTYSVTEMRNPRLNNGDWFYAEWDRRHQLKSVFKLMPANNFSLSFSWAYLTGSPDRLTLFREIPERLGIYSRLDAAFEYRKEFNGTAVVLQGGVFNLTDRDNPWYREWVQTIDDEGDRARLRPVKADVYDLGIQPSLSLNIQF